MTYPLDINNSLGYNYTLIGVSMQDKVTIKIPRELYQKLSQMIEGSGFSSVTEFIVFVMRSLASSGEVRGVDKLTEEEVKAVRERLRRLGYL
jgi:Arc/MetJ-type ribon-helix-helix transcriptional regulator